MFFVDHEAKLIPNLIQKIKTLPKVLRHIFLNVFFGDGRKKPAGTVGKPF